MHSQEQVKGSICFRYIKRKDNKGEKMNLVLDNVSKEEFKVAKVQVSSLILPSLLTMSQIHSNNVGYGDIRGVGLASPSSD